MHILYTSEFLVRGRFNRADRYSCGLDTDHFCVIQRLAVLHATLLRKQFCCIVSMLAIFDNLQIEQQQTCEQN
ncbi:hypothetical protein T11_3172 [Trichinella zimbabwensis]|uniref:Uncharacterized protein n=1 Tax=Trichinella zimbabwensis TaxID=268475 RepID=A0A0V1I0B5_9BILA|nr:hypothetical protein T11_3172 [Trichinella zimbabwensis]